SGVISGAGGLIKIGSGTMILSAATNSYGGVTTVGGGVLQVTSLVNAGTNSAIGTNGTIILTNGGVLNYAGATTTNNRVINLASGNGGIGVSNTSMALTISGVISNSGALVKSGAGTLILVASNSYSGGTLLNAGTLSAGNPFAFGSGSVTVASNTTLNLSNLSVANTLVNNGGILTNLGTVSGAQLSGGTTILSASSNTVAEVSGTATVNVSGANTTITNMTGGTVNAVANITLRSYDDGDIDHTTEVTIASGSGRGSIRGAGRLTKTGSGTLTLSGSNSYTGITTISEGEVSISTNAALASTTKVSLNSGTVLKYTGGSAILDRNIEVTNGTGTIRNTGGGTLALSGTLSKSGTVLTLSGGAFNITGTISGASANSDLIVDGAVVTLNNTNTYNGPTYIRNAGALVANVVGAMPTNTRSAVIMDDTGTGSSALTNAASQQIASLTGAASSSATIATNTSLTIGTTATNTTFAGVISGGGSLVKDGASTQTLTGSNTYSGGTVVSAGTLSGDSTSLQGSISNSAAVVFNQAANGTFAGALSGSGTLLKTNAGTLTLTGANTQSGTTIGQGTLQIGNGGTTGSLAGVITNNGILAFNRSDNLTNSGTISGTGSLTKNGNGTLTLSGASYSGGTLINAGALAGSTGALQGNLTNNGTVIFDQGTNGTYAGMLSGSGSVNKAGAGQVTFTTDNSYTGSTWIQFGTLNLNAALGAAKNTASVTVSTNATLLISQSHQVNNSATVTLSGGTIQTASGVTETFGALNLTTGSFLNFGAVYGSGSSMNFGAYTATQQLSINNFDFGSTLTFGSDLTSSINNSSLFTFTNGGISSSSWNGSTFTITAIPETSTYVAVLGLLALCALPLARRKRAQVS
ncbi:MAG: autotransporter-associated beta strand repeat-containing protein, partial [Chthoniobacterales bacterium]